MSKVYVFMADGCEEVEALTPVDLLRRAGHEVCMVSIMGRPVIVGAHNISIGTDARIEEGDWADGDLYLLPGGMPGTKYLGENQKLTELLTAQYGQGKRLAAICAAPSVFGKLGLLKGKKAVCYPGMESTLEGAQPVADPVVTDGTITTSKGVGAAMDFGLELIRLLDGEEKAQAIKEEVVYPYGK